MLRHATPAKAMPTAKTALMPCMYATIIPGSSSGANTFRNSEAPVAITRAGSTVGAVKGNLATSWLTKAACPAYVVKAPPTV